MEKPQVVGTIQYIEWLILIYRVQPSFVAGVYPFLTDTHGIHGPYLTGRGVCIHATRGRDQAVVL